MDGNLALCGIDYGGGMMARYIDAKKFFNLLCTGCGGDMVQGVCEECCASFYDIKAMAREATVDVVATVKHGRWKTCFDEDGYFCTNCNAEYLTRHNYCPNCGAKMDTEVENNSLATNNQNGELHSNDDESKEQQ